MFFFLIISSLNLISALVKVTLVFHMYSSSFYIALDFKLQLFSFAIYKCDGVREVLKKNENQIFFMLDVTGFDLVMYLV